MTTKKSRAELVRIAIAVILCTGGSVLAMSCSPKETAENTPPPPPRDSPESPVRRVNPRMADKANAGMSTAAKPMKRARQ